MDNIETLAADDPGVPPHRAMEWPKPEWFYRRTDLPNDRGQGYWTELSPEVLVRVGCDDGDSFAIVPEPRRVGPNGVDPKDCKHGYMVLGPLGRLTFGPVKGIKVPREDAWPDLRSAAAAFCHRAQEWAKWVPFDAGIDAHIGVILGALALGFPFRGSSPADRKITLEDAAIACRHKVDWRRPLRAAVSEDWCRGMFGKHHQGFRFTPEQVAKQRDELEEAVDLGTRGSPRSKDLAFVAKDMFKDDPEASIAVTPDRWMIRVPGQAPVAPFSELVRVARAGQRSIGGS